MTTQIKVLRENLVKTLSEFKDDNVSISGLVIQRKLLLDAMKLQNQAGTEQITLNYGNATWQGNDNIKDKPCLQFVCDHTIMRFFDSPKANRVPVEFAREKAIPLDFVDYRTITEKQELSGVCLDTTRLYDALSFVLHGVATEESRPVLTCVLFDCGNDTLKLITADGFRLPIAEIPAQGIRSDLIMIHSSDIVKLMAFLKSNTTGKGKKKTTFDTYMTTAEKAVKFSSEHGVIEFDKHDGEFPKYGQLIPTTGTKIEFIASQFLEAVKSTSMMARDGSGIIRLEFMAGSPGSIKVSAKSEEIGDSVANCDAIVEADCKTAANSKYLIDCLGKLGDSKVELKITTPSSPMVFKVDQKTEVIMPMFVQW